MSHMVIFTTPDGSEVYNRFSTVEEAVPFLEKLRNERGVDNAKLFTLQEIEFGFRPIYKVTLGPPAVEASTSASAPKEPAAAPTANAASRGSFSAEPGRFTAEEQTVDEQSPVGVGADKVSSSSGSGTTPIFGVPSSVPPADSADDSNNNRRGLFGR